MSRLINKNTIPEFTLLLTGNLIPLVAVLQGRFAFINLVLLFFFDHVITIIVNYFKLSGATLDFSLTNDFRVDTSKQNFKTDYLKTIKTGYLVSYFILFLILTILMSIPVYTYLEVAARAGNVISLQSVLFNKWMLIMVVFSVIIACINLWLFYATPQNLRNSAESLSFVDQKAYVLFEIVLILGVVFALNPFSPNSMQNNFGITAYATGITFVKLYIATKKYNLKINDQNTSG